MATAQQRTSIRIGLAGRGRRGLLQGTALQAAFLLVVALPAAAQPAPNARPTGGLVTGGAASILSAPNTTTITQTSQRAAIDWRSFDVGAKQSVTFEQPSSSAVTLNRVVGPDPSAIAGRISANGRIIIANQSGVIFTPGAQVDAQSVVISAASQSPADFMAGRTSFNQPARPGARVVNQGTITVKQAGLVGLVAPQVANSGVINARLGHVVMAGAETHTLDMYGDGLLSIDVTNQVRTAPRGGAALVTNTGTIVAEGGTVTLTAAAADGLVQTLVEAGGRISARGAGGKAGRITIAGTGGSVEIDGALDVRGTAPGAAGGQITVAATDTVNVAAAARINASGPAGGGGVALGSATGTRRTLVQTGARIAADATRAGDGGTVKVLSTSATIQRGRITARGGHAGGDGGTVEVSSQTGLRLGGGIDVSAASGRPGTILVDPRDLTIAAGGTTPVAANDPNLDYASGGTLADAVIDPASLVALNGNVHLQASRSLTVASSVSLTAAGAGLTLESGNDLRVNAGVALSADGPVVLSAGTVFGNSSAVAGYNAGAALTIGGPVTSRGSSLSFAAGAGGIVFAANVVGQSIQLSTGGPVTQTGGIIATTGTASPLSDGLQGFAASVSLTQPNAITAIPYLIAATGGIAVNEAAGGTIALGSIGVTTAGQSIRITTDNLTELSSRLLPRFTAIGGTVTLAPATSGRDIEVYASGAADPSRLSIPADILRNSQAGTLVLGGASTGGIALGRAGDFVDLRAASFGESSVGIDALQLTATGAVTQGGSLGVDLLTGQAASISLPSAGNLFATLGSATAAGNLAVTSGQNLAVGGPVNAGGTATLAATGAGSALTLAGTVTAPTVVLDSTAATTQTAGIIVATTLGGAAAGGSGDVTLSGANRVSNIGSYALEGNFTYAGTVPLTLRGTVGEAVATTGTVSVANAGALTLAATGTIAAGTVSLTATGAGATITQAGTAAIVAGTLAASGSAITLASGANQVGAVTNLTATGASGGIALTDAAPVTVFGTVSVPSGQSVTFLDDAMRFNSGSLVNAPAGRVTLAPATAGRGIELIGFGAGSSGVLSLGPGTELAVHTGTLQLGSASAGAIAVGRAGDVIDLSSSAGTLALVTAGTITEGGTLTVATLTGSAARATLGNANTIQALGVFTTASGFTLADAQALAVAGPVTDSASIAIGVGANLAITGAIQGANVALQGQGGIGLAGNVNTSGGLSLTSPGIVSQTGGAITAALLTGTTGGTDLSRGANQVVNVGSFSSGKSFALTVGKDLNVAGPLTAGSVALTAGTGIVVAGPVTAGSVALTAGAAITEPAGGTIVQSGGNGLTGSAASATFGQSNQVATLANFTTSGGFVLRNGVQLAVTGTVADPVSISLRSGGSMAVSGTVTSAGTVSFAIEATSAGTGGFTQGAGVISGATVSLTAGGRVVQTGTLSAGTFSGSSGGPAAIAGGADTIAVLGGFTSVGGFSLVDSRALTVTGPVTDTAAISLSATGDLNLAAALSGPGGAAVPSVTLVASGAIAQSAGVITTGALSGSAASVALTGANAVAALYVFTSGGEFTLVDTVPLSVAGAVSAGNGATLTLSDDTPSLASTGSLTALGGTVVLRPATTGDAVTLGGSGIGGTPAITAATLVVGAPDAGPVTITGAFNLANVATLDLLSAGAITETGAGALGVGVLTGGGESASLGGANTIGTLAPFKTTGSFALTTASGGLTVGGPVNDPASVSLTVGGDLSLAGSIATSVLALNVTGAVTQQAGSLAVATLTGSVGGSVALNAAGNAVVTLGRFSSDIGRVAATDRFAPVEGGGTIAPPASVGATGFSLTNAQALSVTGLVTDPISVSITTTGSASPITLAGTLQSAAVNLAASGAITQVSGQILATTLTGSGTTVTLAQVSNAIANLGSFAASGTIVIDDRVPLTVTGAASAAGSLTLRDDTPAFAAGGALSAPGGTVTLAPLFSGGTLTLAGATPVVTAGTLVLGAADAGTVTIATALTLPNVPTLDLVSNSDVIETGAGAISVATLTGTASTATLNGANRIGQLAAFTSAGTFSLTTTGTLAVQGTVAVGNGQALTIAADEIDFAAGALLSAPGGNIALLPVGLDLTLGGAGTTGAAVTSAGFVAVGSPTVQSVTVAGAINFGAGSTVQLQAMTISETPQGAIGVGTLAAQGASIALDGSNRVGTLGNVSSSGPLSFTNATSLTVLRQANGIGSLSLTVAGDLMLSPFAVVGSHGTVSLAATGSIDGGAANIVASSLAGSARSATLTGSNSIQELKNFSVVGDLNVFDFSSLVTRGGISAGGTMALSTFGALTIGGGVRAEVLSLNAQSGIAIVGGNVNAGTIVASSGAGISLANELTSGPVIVRTLGSLSAVGDVDIGDAVPGLVVSGPVTSTNGQVKLRGQNLLIENRISGNAVSLTDDGNLSETAPPGGGPVGSIQATSFSFQGASAALDGPNRVGQVGASNVSGSLSLNDLVPVSITGLVAGAVALQTPGDVTLGTGNKLSSLTVTAGGALASAPSVTDLSVGLLSATASSVNVSGTVATLGSVSTPGSLQVQSLGLLTVAGPATAATVNISGTGGLTLQGAASTGTSSLRSDGQVALRGGSLATDSLLLSASNDPTLAPQIAQSGTLTAAGAPLTIQLGQGGGLARFNDLEAPSVAVTLALGNGTALGQVNVGSLLVQGIGGAARLTGRVGGITGTAAAQASRILPAFDPLYQLNGCAIAAITCTIAPPPEQSPPNSMVVPSTIFTPSSFLRPDLLSLDLLSVDIGRERNEVDVPLPNISDRDY